MTDDLDQPLITPLVKGLTRPPSLLGVPYQFFMLIGVVSAVIFLVTKNLLMLLTILPLYAVGRIMIVRDPAIFEIMLIRGRRTPPRSKVFWGATSYRV
jgi:type IV secretion system protein VirB3